MERIQHDVDLHPYAWDPPDSDLAQPDWDPAEELARLLSAQPAETTTTVPLATAPRRRNNRRRVRREARSPGRDRRVGHVTLLVVSVSLSALAMLVWSVAYSYYQLSGIASAVLPDSMARYWPLTVFGPWLVAALSVVRAAVQQQAARRSWGVVLAASAMAVALCVGNTSPALLAWVVFGIPPVTAVVCLWELVGQISGRHRPRHAATTKRSTA
ncbi:DUF2637 domain-containing protein [Streptomyces sp. WMMC905]|uniref:DUF2637 domain-containing protein n=1 Tax=Streptomyces sp. WMMC905 TaxID=3404123 RepID=UPI003B93D612